MISDLFSTVRAVDENNPHMGKAGYLRTGDGNNVMRGAQLGGTVCGSPAAVIYNHSHECHV